MTTTTRLSVSSLAAVLFALASCNSPMAVDKQAPAIHLEASRNNVLVNESVTLFVKSENTLGKNPKVTWTSSLGSVKPEREGLLDFGSDHPKALFTSNQPGTAVITATLILDDGQKLSDSVNLTVNPVR
jgi:hypothetical protein